MTHLPYVVPSYALGVIVPFGYAAAAWLRLRAARRRLAALDPRGRA